MPAFFNNRIYYGAAGDSLRTFQFTNAQLQTSPVSQTGITFTYPGTTPGISANGASNAILWAVENTDPAVLHAYDASDLSHELYNSNQAGARDQFGTGNKFITPTIANGQVFVGTTNGVGVFGLLTSTGPDFSVSVSPSSASVKAGQSATYTLTVTSVGGFNQAVALSCTGAPSLASCTISPSSVTPSGSGAATATTTVTTTASTMAPRRWPASPKFPAAADRVAPLVFLLMLARLGVAKATRLRSRLEFACVFASVALWAGCGGGGTHNLGTPPGVYTLAVTGTSTSGSSTLTNVVNLTLTVQ